MKHCVVEDSSFVISVIDTRDSNHSKAVAYLREMNVYKDKIKILIPSLVFYETFFTLVKQGFPLKQVEEKLWNFLYIDNIVNVTTLETECFKYIKRLPDDPALLQLKTADFIITSIGIEYDAQILTFDRRMHNRIYSIYSEIYDCNLLTEWQKFITNLKTKL